MKSRRLAPVDHRPWWQKPLAILGNHYDFGQPNAARHPTIEHDPATIERMVRWKRKAGFDAYTLDATVAAGQRLDVSAALKPHKSSVVTRWWFWTGIVTVVAGAVVTTYALTRPAPQRPPVDGGGLGWSVKVP